MKKAQHNPNSGVKTVNYDSILSRQHVVGEGVAYTNSNLQLRYFNPAFEELYAKVAGCQIFEYESVASTPLFNSFSEGIKMMAQVLGGSTMEWPLRTMGNTPISIRLEPAYWEGDINGIFIRLLEAAPAWHTSHLNFKAMLESSRDAIILFSPEGKPMYASPSVRDVLGYTPEEVLQLDIHGSVHPDDLAENQKVMEKAIFNPGIPIRGHVSRIMHKDGTYHWYDSTVVNLLNDPAVGGVVDNIREVSEGAAAQAMMQTGALYDTAVENAHIGVWELDVRSLHCRRNIHHDQLFGYTEPIAQWTPETFFKHVMPEDKPEVRKKYYQSLQDGCFDFETRIIWPDQSVHWVKLKGKAVKGADGSEKIAGTIADVTELYEAREALKMSEDRLRKIVDNLPDGLVITDSRGDPLYWNPAALELHGFSTLEEGKRQLPEFLKLFKLQNENGVALPFKEWPLPRLLRKESVKSLKVNISSLKNGWKKIFKYNGGTFPDVYGKDVYFLTISDVTNRHANGKTVKQDEEKLWEAFHLSTMPMVISRKADGVCLDLNKSAEELLGYGYDEYTGKLLLRLNFKSDAAYQTFFDTFSSNAGLYLEQTTTIQTMGGVKRIKIFSLEHVSLGEEDCRLLILIHIPARK